MQFIQFLGAPLAVTDIVANTCSHAHTRVIADANAHGERFTDACTCGHANANANANTDSKLKRIADTYTGPDAHGTGLLQSSAVSSWHALSTQGQDDRS